MKDSYGQHGWKEFHRNRKDILNEYDKLLDQTKNRPIQVAHGIAVEAYLRKWLAEFLPKKFGVTSGYIIPDLYTDSDKIYHYDIIIYNKLDSPILWIEGNEDNSEQGKHRAIPAKHILAVYEVKSRLNKKNVISSLEKLNQTYDFKEQLNHLYHCGLIFIDLKEIDNNNESIIKELFKGIKVHGFMGGMVLRYEVDNTCTGKINMHKLDSKDESSTNDKNIRLKPLAKPMDELNIYTNEEGGLTINEPMAGIKLVITSQNNWSFSKTYEIMYENENQSVHLSWSRSHFSDFCTQLLSSLEGLAIDDKNRPSFGQIFDTAERKKAPLQGTKKIKDKPFLKIKVYDGEEEDKLLKIKQEGKEGKISFWLVFENWGDCDVVFSDDSFKNKTTLLKGQYAMKERSYLAKINDKSKTLIDIINEDFRIPYRLVYYVKNSEDSKKDFFAIEQEAVYNKGKFKFE
jgi:hypothetical protein